MRSVRKAVQVLALGLFIVAAAIGAPPRARADDAYLKEFVWTCVDEYVANGCELGNAHWYNFVYNLRSHLETDGGWENCCGLRDGSVTSQQIDVGGSNIMDSGDLSIWTGHSYYGVSDPDYGNRLHMASQHDLHPPDCEDGRDCGNIKQA
jgi:hypothetical protein